MAKKNPYAPKRTLKQKFDAAAKTTKTKMKRALFATTALAALVGAPGYYTYGTVQEQEVKVHSWSYDRNPDTLQPTNYVLNTNHGAFRNDKNLLWLKGEDDADRIYDYMDRGKTYRVKSYGNIPFLPFVKSNILSVVEVTPDELRERRRLAEEESKTRNGADSKGDDAAAKTAGLSGEFTRVVITAHGYDIEMTVPKEALEHVRIEKVEQTKPVHIVQQPRP